LPKDISHRETIACRVGRLTFLRTVRCGKFSPDVGSRMRVRDELFGESMGSPLGRPADRTLSVGAVAALDQLVETSDNSGRYHDRSENLTSARGRPA
jgi:hypothetical protein